MMKMMMMMIYIYIYIYIYKNASIAIRCKVIVYWIFMCIMWWIWLKFPTELEKKAKYKTEKYCLIYKEKCCIHLYVSEVLMKKCLLQVLNIWFVKQAIEHFNQDTKSFFDRVELIWNDFFLISEGLPYEDKRAKFADELINWWGRILGPRHLPNLIFLWEDNFFQDFKFDH